jgi:hypothetical protein
VINSWNIAANSSTVLPGLKDSEIGLTVITRQQLFDLAILLDGRSVPALCGFKAFHHQGALACSSVGCISVDTQQVMQFQLSHSIFPSTTGRYTVSFKKRVQKTITGEVLRWHTGFVAI